MQATDCYVDQLKDLNLSSAESLPITRFFGEVSIAAPNGYSYWLLESEDDVFASEKIIREVSRVKNKFLKNPDLFPTMADSDWK
jgi:hypothetical protein